MSIFTFWRHFAVVLADQDQQRNGRFMERDGVASKYLFLAGTLGR
jgi:hypothetical protein